MFNVKFGLLMTISNQKGLVIVNKILHGPKIRLGFTFQYYEVSITDRKILFLKCGTFLINNHTI